MEKNIHDDRLEDYVRKSFEDYEEAPASDMWERIEADILPVQEEKRRRLRPFFWQLSAAAAILLLLSGLVCGRLYYENKIRDLSADQAEKNAREQTPGLVLHPTLPPRDISVAEAEKPLAQQPPEQVQHSNGSSRQKTNTISQQSLAPTRSGTPSGDKQRSLPPLVSATGANNSQTRKDNKEAVVRPPVAGISTPSSFEIPLNQVPVSDHAALPVLEPKPMDEDFTKLKIDNLAPFPPASPSAITNDFSLHLPQIRPVEKAGRPSGWYLGLQTTPVLLVDKPGPERTGVHRPRLVSAQEKTTFSADYWLKFGKKGTNTWGFESGLGFRTIERNAVHTARFRLMNGRPNSGGGSQDRSYDFDYDLDTYGGSAEITLRMDQVDPGVVIPESEPLRIQVKTSERVALLRVPALATARLGNQRLQTVLKAGLVGNVVLANELDIVTRISENTRFRPAQGSNAYTLQPDRSGKFFLGYQLSAGLEYRSGRHLSWVLEPALAGDFARKNSAGKQLPSIMTVGLNMGVNYWF